ncbi:hypothetical protein ABH926_009757 [Catenulispora sp. GP43]|uniref:hypothetical protein n=1 Tax=Catenulispora sp. GP43 TaxID=3156263 RepID=UPI0035125E30
MSSQEFEGVGGDRDRDRDADGAGAVGDEVAGYAAEVRAQFADLPEADSAELLEDLEDHLREVATEDAGTLRERLGAPAAYARELRQAAGLPEPGEGSGSGGARRPRRTLRARARQTLADAEGRARQYRAGREVLDFLPSLRPAWWVLRGWVAVRLLEVMTTNVDPWHDFALIPQVGNSTFTGFIALLVAVPASVYAARRTVPEGWRRRAMGAGEGILVLFTVAMALSSAGGQDDYTQTASGVSYVQGAPQQGLAENGKQISNLYVYDQSGKLLDGVLVYDQDGQPVGADPFMNGYGSEIDNNGWLDGNGALVPNAYPRQLFQQQWDNVNGGRRYVTVPPPLVNIPRGVHRGSTPTGPQSSATPSTTPSTTPPATPSTTPTGGATGAQPSSTLPSTPAPSSTTG